MENRKKTFPLRIGTRTYAALERWAADEFRSVNGQIEMLLDRALREAGRLPASSPPSQDPAVRPTDPPQEML